MYKVSLWMGGNFLNDSQIMDNYILIEIIW